MKTKANVKPTNQNLAVVLTLPLPGIPAPIKRGRPITGKALSNAERQKKWRKSHGAIDTGEQMTATIKRLAEQFDLPISQVTRELIRFALCNKKLDTNRLPLALRKQAKKYCIRIPD